MQSVVMCVAGAKHCLECALLLLGDLFLVRKDRGVIRWEMIYALLRQFERKLL